MTKTTFILRGIGGSTAHGLATAESDIDMHGVFSYPTEAFWHIRKPPMSIVKTSPDESYHELEKFLALAGKSNPTVLELLWLDDYTDMEPDWGQHLLDIRSSFLSAERVRGAYLGYATQQFKKLEESDRKAQSDSTGQDPYFESSTKRRTRKHAKHLIRLLEAGIRLYTTGELQVRVEDPDKYHAIMDEWPLGEVAHYATEQIEKFNTLTSVLPARADWNIIERYLHDYRAAHC